MVHFGQRRNCCLSANTAIWWNVCEVNAVYVDGPLQSSAVERHAYLNITPHTNVLKKTNEQAACYSSKRPPPVQRVARLGGKYIPIWQSCTHPFCTLYQIVGRDTAGYACIPNFLVVAAIYF